MQSHYQTKYFIMLKDQILAALKLKYKNLGLSDKVLEGMADMLAATTTEEAGIETAVVGVETLLKSFQSDADTRVTTAVKTAKAEKKEPEAKEGAKEEPATNDFAKIIQDALSPLVKEIADLKSGNVTKSRQQVLDDKLKDANPIFKAAVTKAFKRMQFETEDDFNEYITEVETDLGEQKQQETNEQLKDVGKPFGGNSSVKENEVSPMMKQILADRAEAAKAASTN